MITIDLTNQFLSDRKENKVMSTNDPKEPKKVSLVQQAEEGVKNTSDCCCGGNGGGDDCCG